MDRQINFDALVKKAKQFDLEGFDKKEWDQDTWNITAGRLLKLSGKNVQKVTLSFNYPPKLGGEVIQSSWSELTKAILVLRFHRSQQAAPNQRNFITAIGYVSYEMAARNLSIRNLTPEYLDQACHRISKDYNESTAYNLHKAVGEFTAHCDANGICNVYLNYKYAAIKRPSNVGGLDHKRLDDPNTVTTSNEKMVDSIVFKIIGELYLNVPKNHKYRFYVLVLSMLALTGRRFSEISLLPNQSVMTDEEGRGYLNYFPRKHSKGEVFTPIKKFFIPTDCVSILRPIIEELKELCKSARATASEMQVNNGPDLNRFIDLDDNKKLYKKDLVILGLPETSIDTTGWIRCNGYAKSDSDSHRGENYKPSWYTNKKGVIAFCERDFHPNSIKPIHTDQQGKEYYLKDMLLVRNLGLSTGFYAHWLATQCTHSMMVAFLRYFPDLTKEYASSSLIVNFTSHKFRHTLNTLLDEGGLSDLMQAEWFGRTNKRDNKAYQHTSREKRALILREDIKAGKVGGLLADKVMNLPVDKQDAVLLARVNAVHDVGTGICVHNFVQTPCERHLQCSAACDDYLWAKDDTGRFEELKRMYAITVIAKRTAEEKTKDSKPKKSMDWYLHNEKKLKTLSQQLKDNGIEAFDVEQYLKEKRVG